ncbi:hypothetical protein HU230_0012570 [Bradyrhizobium quebecense]|uniref:Uncharacterized protein n=1 Tax=Bradyrhizobium quebecense TaxID=2748629 RepID=A0A973WP10_9BRAD|nr:hypothetical protein [Bradyrhizobium quebecense]UGA46823.1 hypothetical protein HU230_0012570 [Bradyrhizobium quebecense]
MKYNCDAWADRRKRKKAERRAYLGSWHPKFAWFPIKLKHGDCRWLETVDCKRTVSSTWSGDSISWNYRAR